jgi:hypothetical protein
MYTSTINNIMSRKLTPKERFLRILKKDKYYKGDLEFTKKLYRRYLRLSKSTPNVNSKILFECITTRSREFFLRRGFSLEEAKEQVRKLQSRGFEFRDKELVLTSSAKRKNTLESKTEEEKNEINRKKGLACNVDHLITKYGITRDEALRRIEKAKKQRRESYSKYLDSIGGCRRKWSCRCVEYWRERGYTLEEAREHISRQSDTRSIRAIQERYNVSREEALRLQREVSDKCSKTFRDRTPEEKRDILLRRTRNSKKYSKKSQIFFEKVFAKVSHLPITFLSEEHEYFLWGNEEEKRIYFYDLTIPELKIMIEYNGIIFHPRKKDTWATTVEESIKKDNTKKILAESNGFKVFYVWEDEKEDIAISRIVDIIFEEYEHKTNNKRTSILL